MSSSEPCCKKQDAQRVPPFPFSAAAAAFVVVSVIVHAVCTHVTAANQKDEDHNEPQAPIILKTHIFSPHFFLCYPMRRAYPNSLTILKSYPSAVF
jgi:hypothetical protein